MNPLLTSLVSDVYALTNRPDLVSETLIAVRNATLKAHRVDFFYKDIFETGVSFSSAEYLQTLDYKLLIPTWRALKYIRKVVYDGVNPPVEGDILRILTPEDILDSYSVERENVVYAAGGNLQIKSNTELQYISLGCYVYPNVTEAGYASWIAEEHSSVIVYEAIATVFKTIGYDEQAAAYRAMVGEEYMQLKASNIQANGY